MSRKPDSGDHSGISGLVTIRPVRPHAIKGAPNVEPYEAKIDVLDGSRHPVTTFVTSADGSFRIPLAPGTYILRPRTDAPYPRASEQTVTVKPMKFTSVQITFDTGMR